MALAFFLLFPCVSWDWSGMALGTSNGDTIMVMRAHKQAKIGLYGIDTPERGQAFGLKAKQFRSDMVFGKIVEVEVMDTDRYGRTVAMIFADLDFRRKERRQELRIFSV